MDIDCRPSHGHDMKDLRRQAGLWLRKRRQRLGLSQRALATLVGAEPYTAIGQLEVGRGRIPPERYERWAQALRMSPVAFARTILQFYDPETYRLLFGDAAPSETVVHLVFRKVPDGVATAEASAGKGGDKTSTG